MTIQFTGIAVSDEDRAEYDRLWNDFLEKGQKALDKPRHTEEPKIGFQA